MGTIESPVKKIEDLIFKKMPTTPTNMRLVRVPHSSLLLGKDEKGNFYAHCWNGPQEHYYYVLSDWLWTEDLMLALIRLGAITQAEADEHIEAAKAESARRKAVNLVQSLTSELGEYGLKLTQGQLRKLKKAAEE